MSLRKLNAWISLLTTVLLLDHAIFYSVWMLSRCSIPKAAPVAPRLLAVLMVLHAVLSILSAVRARKGAEKKPTRMYTKLNIRTIIQRFSGIAMLVLLGLHIAGAINHFRPHLLHGILHPFFFAAALAHVAVSLSKSLITLGIGNAKLIRILDIVMPVLCGLILLAALIGFYLCLFLGVAK